MILALKAAAVAGEVLLTTVVATSPAGDELATRIALYAAAGAGLAWLFRNVLRPIGKILHRMAQAVEALEDLPLWRRQTDARIDKASRRIRHMELGLGQMASGQMAILRELGLENSVRQQFADPVDFERWLAEDADDDEADEG